MGFGVLGFGEEPYAETYLLILTHVDLEPTPDALSDLHLPLMARFLSWHTHWSYTLPYILHPTPYTLHPTPYTLHPTPYTLHPTPTPYTLQPTPNTLNPKLLQPSTRKPIGAWAPWVSSASRPQQAVGDPAEGPPLAVSYKIVGNDSGNEGIRALSRSPKGYIL